MRKRICFIALLFFLLTTIVNADTFSVNNFGAKYTYKTSDNYPEIYPHNMIYFDDNELVRYDVDTGEKHTKKIDPAVLVYQTNDIVYISSLKDINKVTVLNEYFEEVKSSTFDSFELDYSDNSIDYYAISGLNKIDDKYHRYYYRITPEGDANKDSEMISDYKTFPVKVRNSSNIDVLAFMDNYNNMFSISNVTGQFIPMYTNSDGSYMYYTGCTMQKRSQDGSVIDETTFSDCDSIRGIKNNNYYYVVSAKANSGKIYYKVYKIDEELDVIASEDLPTATSKGVVDFEQENNLITTYQLYIKNNKVNFYASNIDSSGNTQPILITIKEDLTYESKGYAFDGNVSFDKNIMARDYDYENLQDIEAIIEAKELADKPDNYFVYVDAVRDGDNYMVYSSYGTLNGNSVTSQSKAFIYYDKDLNEIFRFKCSENLEDRDLYFSIMAASYKGNIMLIASTVNGNVIKMFDKEGHELKDFSDDIQGYDILTASTIFTGDNGLFVEFSFMQHSKGEVLYNDNVDPTKQVVKALPYGRTPNVLIYYSNLYNINKKTDGHGKITANYEKADVGDIVKFTITPDEGYELDYVKVTDVKGVVIEFTDYTFTMPSADVTIEAVFKKIDAKAEEKGNPNTADIAITTIILLVISSMGFIIYSNKKKKELN